MADELDITEEEIIAQAEEHIQQEAAGITESVAELRARAQAAVEQSNRQLVPEDWRQPNEGDENYGPTPSFDNTNENVYNDGSLDEPISKYQQVAPAAVGPHFPAGDGR